MTATYGITEEIYTLGSDRRISYGIAAYADAELDGTAAIIASVHDITSDKEKLSDLIQACNRLGLSTIHLHDVIEDFFAE